MQTSSTPLLQIRQLSKAYAGPVLQGIDLAVASGEVVALTGENGAGKSTLSKIVAGLVTADAGEMFLAGGAYRPANRAAGERAGVRMVLQELGLIATLSVAENLLLGAMPARAGFIRFGELERNARKQLARVGLNDVDPRRPVGELGIGQQQLVEIARGLMGELRMLILDEPTAMLTAPEVDRLFEQVAGLRQQGVGILYISHRLDEIQRIADRVVVLRDGRLVVDRPAREVGHDDLVSAMIGRDYTGDAERPRRSSGGELLRIEGFTRARSVRNVSLRVHAGEVLGIAGLVGSGRTELLRLIFGADRKDAGELFLNGSRSATGIDSPTEAVAHGIGLLTEDRKSQGLLPGQSLTANLTLANLGATQHRGWLSQQKERAAFDYWSQRLRIRARDADQAVDELSGGNQQKVLLGRWLHRDCRVLLLDEPTRGIDIGAREDIYKELDILAAAGKAMLMVSSDLRELMAVCDRIAVMSDGVLVATFERGGWSEQALLQAAFAEYRSGARSA